MSQTDLKPDRGSPPPTPRWVKVSGVIVIVLIVLFVILHLTGNSPMGNHMNMNMNMPPTQQGVQQP